MLTVQLTRQYNEVANEVVAHHNSNIEKTPGERIRSLESINDNMNAFNINRIDQTMFGNSIDILV